MFKVFVGIGILATPFSLQKVGVIGGPLCIFLCGIFNVYTMNL
jgi:amino acid permease